MSSSTIGATFDSIEQPTNASTMYAPPPSFSGSSDGIEMLKAMMLQIQKQNGFIQEIIQTNQKQANEIESVQQEIKSKNVEIDKKNSEIKSIIEEKNQALFELFEKKNAEIEKKNAEIEQQNTEIKKLTEEKTKVIIELTGQISQLITAQKKSADEFAKALKALNDKIGDIQRQNRHLKVAATATSIVALICAGVTFGGSVSNWFV